MDPSLIAFCHEIGFDVSKPDGGFLSATTIPEDSEIIDVDEYCDSTSKSLHNESEVIDIEKCSPSDDSSLVAFCIQIGTDISSADPPSTSHPEASVVVIDCDESCSSEDIDWRDILSNPIDRQSEEPTINITDSDSECEDIEFLSAYDNVRNVLTIDLSSDDEF